MRARAALSFALAASLPIALALAQVPEGKIVARLSWVRVAGAETCASGDELQKDVGARLGRDAFVGVPSRFIEGFVQKNGTKWSARLFIRDASGTQLGTRELNSEAADCASLSSAVGLAIALAIDPQAALGAPPSASASPSTSIAPSVAPAVSTVFVKVRAAPSVLVMPAPRTSGDAALVTAGVAIGGGLVRRVQPGVALSFDPMLSSMVRPSIGALLVPAIRQSEDTVGFGLAALSASACARLVGEVDDRAAMDLCGGLLAGLMHAVVYTLEPTRPGDRFWLGMAFGGRARVRIAGPFVLDFSGQAVVPVTRYSFLADGSADPLWRQPALAFSAQLGIGWLFR